MKKFFAFLVLITLHARMEAQPDQKFTDLMQKGIKQLREERKHDAALQSFNEAIKLKPANAEAYGWRGYTYLEKAELEEYNNDEDYFDYRKNASFRSALKDFDKSIQLNPSLATSFYHRGMAYAMNREIKNALEDLTKAQQLDPSDKKVAGSIKDCKEHYVDYCIDMARDEIANGLAKKKDSRDTAYRMHMWKAFNFCTDGMPYDPENSVLFYRRAEALYWLNKFELADADIKKTLALHPGDKDALGLQKMNNEMIEYAKELDKKFAPSSKADVIETKPPVTSPASSNSNDEVIRNLGSILQQVIASATDPSKHFGELKGRKMRSRFYRGDTYKSSIELPGALETFLSSFLNNNSHNYYYWDALIDEEEKANLNGKLKERYKAVCNEVKRLYPDITPVFSYNDENYFMMQINSNVKLKVTYFYSEGYKDLVTLTVIAEHGK